MSNDADLPAASAPVCHLPLHPHPTLLFPKLAAPLSGEKNLWKKYNTLTEDHQELKEIVAKCHEKPSHSRLRWRRLRDFWKPQRLLQVTCSQDLETWRRYLAFSTGENCLTISCKKCLRLWQSKFEKKAKS